MPKNQAASFSARLRRTVSRVGHVRLIAILTVATLLVGVGIAAGVRNWSGSSSMLDPATVPARSEPTSKTIDTDGVTASSSALEPQEQPAPQSTTESPVPVRSEPAPTLMAISPTTNSGTPGASASTDPVQADAGSPQELFLDERAQRPIAATAGSPTKAQQGDSTGGKQGRQSSNGQIRAPKEERLSKAGRSFDGDLRSLPYEKPVPKERPEREEPAITRGTASPTPIDDNEPGVAPSAPSAMQAAAPAPIMNFDGLDREFWGNGSPPDTNGDVGPNHYIQSVNTSVGIYDKATGSPIARFTFNTLMSQGNFGNLCDTDNFGDPVVLYDTFEDRWVLTDFAFKLDASGNVINPPGSFQCFAVSKTSNPVSGGWNFYSINTTGGLGDYPKFGIWPDGLYMTTSMFDYAATGGFQNPRAYALNKAQMYAGAPTVQVVSFDLPASDFTVLPSNARLQTGTPPVGTPNYYVSTWQYLNALSVYKFHVDWNSVSLSTFSAESQSSVSSSWPNASVAAVPQSGTTNTLDALDIRAMMQNQYTNIGGVESLWNTHTVRRGNTSGFAAPRWYQVPVTGGTVAAATQGTTFDPDGANVMHRWMPSLAVDRAGNMALGYSTSSSTSFPSIKYAGRLSTDPVNTFSQTEQLLFAGTASQTGTVTRWGDYSAMSVDPDGCTFWFTTQYVNPALPQSSANRWKTRIGSFKYGSCTAVGTGGTISGTVTASPGGAAISGATVTLGSRTTTTDGTGNYSFSVPAGTYTVMTATASGRSTATATTIPVTDNGTTTRNFSLTATASNACLVDTTQTDFLAGVSTSTDPTTSAGNVTLANPPVVDQITTNYTTSGTGFSGTSFAGQTFTPATTGTLQKIEVNIFCAGCSGTNPNLTVEVRTTSGGNPLMTAPGLLASSTVTGTSSGSGGFMSFTFSSPPTLTAGTVYGFVVRSATTRTTGTQAVLASNGDGLPGGRRQTCSTSSCSNATGTSNDVVFKSYMNFGYATSGDLVSSNKDANPAAGSNPTWGAISWTSTVPAGTTLKFQAAAGNNAAGPFSFVGPDGTASTFFTSGASLAQFNGFRYLKYKALFTGTSAATPTLSDVSICFVNQAATSLTVGSAAGTFGGTVNLSATLTSGGNFLSGKTVDFKLNNNPVGSGVTNASGVATLSNASLAGINAGNYPGGVVARFGGDGSYISSTATNSLDVAAPVYGISGTMIYGGTPAGGTAKYVPGVTMTASGASSGSVQSDSSGVYSLSSLSGGNNTVTPARSGDINGINSTDALRIQQYLVGSVSFTAAQLAAADVSNNGAVNSTDALRIQQWIVGTPTTNVVGQWRFLPSSKNYASLASTLINEDYTGVLMGEVSGNWTAPGPIAWPLFTSEADSEPIASNPLNRSVLIDPIGSTQKSSEPSVVLADVTVTVPTNATASSTSTVLIPVNVSQLPAHGSANEVFTYNFNVQFNPAVLSSPTSVSTGTISAAAGGSLVTSSLQSGVVSVSYTNPNGITGQGTLLYLQFTVAGTASQQSALTFVGTTTSPVPFEFNEGVPTVTTNTGQFTVSSPTAGEVSISGRVLTANGQGVKNAVISLSGNGTASRLHVLTGPFGYYQFDGLAAGETYVVTVNSKSFTFAQPSRIVTLNDSLGAVDFTADPQ